jgi:DNA-binding NtrC family response regulator
MRQVSIIVADDQPLQRQSLAAALRHSGHLVHEAGDGQSVIELLRDVAADIVITDLRMPGLSGLDVVQQVRRLDPRTSIIIMTAFASVDTAIDAMKRGAADYLTKPIDLDMLDLIVARIIKEQGLVLENEALRRRIEETLIKGGAPGLQQVLARATQAATTDAMILIRGESGTGKELLARTIHDLSHRAAKPFVAVNCSALPESLLESELFGHEKGAFTGAHARHFGRVEKAAGGTLFLDEIGDLTPPVQVKLLRFLDSREYSRVGGDEEFVADVRVITATHQNLEELMAAGRFREDLFYRLNVVSLTLPALRDRRDDIPALVEHFLVRFAKRYDRPVCALTPEAMEILGGYHFPGNIRELENIIEQATVLVRGDQIGVRDLPIRAQAVVPRQWLPEPAEIAGDLNAYLEDLERRVILSTLARHANNQSQTARFLGLTESGLRYKLKQWNMTKGSREPPAVAT